MKKQLPFELIYQITALGTPKKTMHANPGAHAAVPLFESIASIDYLDRYVR